MTRCGCRRRRLSPCLTPGSIRMPSSLLLRHTLRQPQKALRSVWMLLKPRWRHCAGSGSRRGRRRGWLGGAGERNPDHGRCCFGCGMPVILVVGIRLGCINHALLTEKAIKASGLKIRWLGSNRSGPGVSGTGRNCGCLATAPVSSVPRRLALSCRWRVCRATELARPVG